MRRTATYTVSAEGRDLGKSYLLTEMPASQAERFAAKAFLAMARAGVQIPEGLENQGLAGLAELGMSGLKGVAWADAEPLMTEMMTCVQALPDPQNPNLVRPLVESDTEEVSTRLKLRAEVVKLHLGFFGSAGRSTSGAAVTASNT